MLVQHVFKQLKPYLNRPIYLAYSGGLDSHVLLHLLSQLQQQQPFDLSAIHIHHGINKNADRWANHCVDCCQQLAIPCHIKKVQLTTQKQHGLEAAARVARYQALQQAVPANALIVTAQHQHDQSETLLLQLFRGAGSKGLSAMPVIKPLGHALLLRPLLTVCQQTLQDYAKSQPLNWIEDDSNDDLRFDRNFLRHRILAPLTQRWTSLHKTLSRVARQQAENEQLLTELAQLDGANCYEKQRLVIPALLKLSSARQKNLIRYWLKQQHAPLPSYQQLQQLINTLQHNASDKQALHYAKTEIHRYRQQLYVFHQLPPRPKAVCLQWQIGTTLSLPYGTLKASLQTGTGLYLPATTSLTIRFRQGGEKIYTHKQQQTLKNWLQKQAVPPWLRDFIPYVYADDKLLAVVGVVTDNRCTPPKDKQGWVLQWHIK